MVDARKAADRAAGVPLRESWGKVPESGSQRAPIKVDLGVCLHS